MGLSKLWNLINVELHTCHLQLATCHSPIMHACHKALPGTRPTLRMMNAGSLAGTQEYKADWGPQIEWKAH